MEIFGIKFAPVNVPLERRLQTLAAAAWFYTFTIGGIILALLTICLTIYTELRWLLVPYFIWAYIIDKDTPERGSRMSPWVRSWRWWKYLKDYFPLKIIKPEVGLEPTKNYLFACFPHGVLPSAGMNCFTSNYSRFKEYFPHHESYLVTLSQQFLLPIHRELVIFLGAVSSSAKAIEYILSKPGGGNVLGIFIGGAKESFNSKPGTYKVILKDRKGFVKLALRSGAHLVPVFSFGETELFDQLEGPRLKKIQEFLRKWIVIAPIIPIGRGFFQYSFGLIPRRHQVTTVFGKPIELPRIERPVQAEVDNYHNMFVEKLTELFEEHKWKYLEEPETKKLIIK